MVVVIATAFVAGCSAHKDEDVTKSPKYNFGSFAGTTWKTKANVALADIERYTGEHQLNLMSPRRFDPTVTNYAPVSGAKILTVLPAGTVIRIERFVMDRGLGADHEVKGRVETAQYSQKEVNVDRFLLAKNRFLSPHDSSSTNWDVNPEMLEKVGLPAK
jgi:hypothetical protein